MSDAEERPHSYASGLTILNKDGETIGQIL